MFFLAIEVSALWMHGNSQEIQIKLYNLENKQTLQTVVPASWLTIGQLIDFISIHENHVAIEQMFDHRRKPIRWDKRIEHCLIQGKSTVKFYFTPLPRHVCSHSVIKF